jgi:hypothetical protein
MDRGLVIRSKIVRNMILLDYDCDFGDCVNTVNRINEFVNEFVSSVEFLGPMDSVQSIYKMV